jgi:hypothetical protein
VIAKQEPHFVLSSSPPHRMVQLLPNLDKLVLTSAPVPPSSSTTKSDEDKPVSMTDVLNEDELFKIFEALAETGQDYASMCETVKGWCSTDKAIRGVCNKDSSIWKTLMKETFSKGVEYSNIGLEDRIRGEGLIYRTFKDDGESPRDIFYNMCAKAGLADAVQKMFVTTAIEAYDGCLWHEWLIEYRDDIEMDDQEFSLKTEEEKKEIAIENHGNPDIGKIKDWTAASDKLFNDAPKKELFNHLYLNDKIFKHLVRNMFRYTNIYLFHYGDPKTILDHGREEGDDTVLKIFNEIGKMLGVRIVCLLKLERDYQQFALNHIDDKTIDIYDTEMYEYIEDTRILIYYAVNMILRNDEYWYPAEDGRDFSELRNQSFEQKLFEYKTDYYDEGFNWEEQDYLDTLGLSSVLHS